MDTAPGAPVVPGYAVTRLLGAGAGSEVWAAVEQTTGEPVAVKVVDPTAHPPGQVRSLAARETAVLDRVSSEHVLRLRATVTLPTGAVAFVVDLAEGGSLAALVAARGRLADGEVVTICSALATALASLHEAGVIHGDLAAGNVLFTGEGKPLLADFAAARLVGESDPPLVAGTPGFVAPEVARGDIPTEASDAYGLGALAWFALTGQPRTTDTEPGLAEAVGFLGRRLGPVVASLLATDPSARPGLRAAAVDFYRAATAVPVTLLRGAADPAAALTRRIRAQAHEEELAAEGTRLSIGRPAWTRPASARALRRLALALAALLAGSAVVLAAGRVAGVLTTQLPVPVVTADTPDPGGILGAPSGLGPPSGPRSLDASGPADRPGAVVGPAPSSAPGSVGAPSPTDPRGEPGSPKPADGPASGPNPEEALRADPAAVLTALADARAAALMAADPARLLQAAAPDSPLHRSDAALLAELDAARSRYADLAFFVRTA